MRLKHTSQGLPSTRNLEFCGCAYASATFFERTVERARYMTPAEYNHPDFRASITENAPQGAKMFEFGTMSAPVVDRTRKAMVYYYRFVPKRHARSFRKL